jgi:hypothetical protein
MPLLDKRFFAGEGELEPDECAKLEVRNLTNEVDSCLREYGWSGEAASCVGLTLSADNRRVDRGVFITRGALGDAKEEAARIWQGGNDNVTLVIKLRNAAVFTFSEGGLTSDIIPSDRLEFAFYMKNSTGPPAVVLESEYAELGISDFCLRLVCCLAKPAAGREGVNVKYTVLLFPMGKENLLRKFDAAQNAAWPGYPVMEGELPLLVRATSAWGCPIMPVLLTGSSLEQHPLLPSGDELRMAISAVMRKAIAAETSKSAKNLLARWRKLAASPDELAPKKGPVEWPQQQQDRTDTGTGK